MTALDQVADATQGSVGSDGQGTGICPTCGKRGKFRFRLGESGQIVFTCHSGACSSRTGETEWLADTVERLVGAGVAPECFHLRSGTNQALVGQQSDCAAALPSPDGLAAAQAVLLGSTRLLGLLHERTGLTCEDVAMAGIGYDTEARRYWLPVEDGAGELQTVIRRDFLPEARAKSLIWKGTRGSYVYAPFEVRPDESVIVAAGERDCLALCARGFSAVCFTNGESSAPAADRLTVLADSHLVFLYDNDAGNHAPSVASAVLPHVAGVEIAEWPDEVPQGYDVCDVLVDPALGQGVIERVIASARPVSTSDAEAQIEDDLYQREIARLRAHHRARLDFNAELVEGRQAASKRSRLMHGESFFLDLPAEPPALWGCGDDLLWVDGEPLLICGDDGTGKSTLDHQLIACRLGIRDTLLNLDVLPTEGRIVYLAMDRPEQARRAGARLFPKDYRDQFRTILKDRLAVWNGPLPVDVLRAPESMAEWIQRQFGSDVSDVHADSLKDIAARLSDDAVGSGINSAIQEVVARGINWVGLHHQRKANGENRNPSQLADVYGSRWLTAGHGSVLMLARTGNDDKELVELRQLKEPMNKVRPMLLRHNGATGRTTVVVESQQPDQILREAGEGGATASQVAAAMFGKALSEVKDAERKRASRALEAMARREQATKQPGTKGGAGGTTASRYIWIETS